MSSDTKYFYVTSKSTYSFGRHAPQLTKFHSQYFVDIDENVEFAQSINVAIDKLNQKKYTTPKTDKYTRVAPITKEAFDKKYLRALQLLSEKDLSEGEFYLKNNDTDWIEVHYFSLDEKNRRSISIDLRDGIDDFDLTVDAGHGHKKRPGVRKNGTGIDSEIFKQYLKLSIQFLYDSDSYLIFLDDFLKNFYAMANEGKEITGLVLSTEKTFEKILAQLEARKTFLQERLMNVDADSEAERIRMRGELQGIKYSIDTIKGTI